MSLKLHIQGQGLPLLCLHGHPGNGRTMAVFTDPLSQYFQTIAPDLRGYGQSRVTQPFTMQSHLSDLATLIDSNQSYLILGWSLGGILALELALQYPTQIRGLILVATAARPRSSHPAITWQDSVLTGISGLLNLAVPAWDWNIKHLGKRSLFRYLVQQHTVEVYQRLAREGALAYLQTSRAATQALYQAIRQGYNRLPDLHRIQVPCLMLYGEQDRHITAAASQETAEHLPDCQLHCYEKTGHLFPWEIPSQMITDIETWLVKYQFIH